jgi:hypothetical protein
MTAARKKVHLPRPGTGGLLTDPLPLWCGLARDLDTCTTSFPHLATCARCIAAQQRYTEESDYQLMRAKRAAESEREAGAADRVHYSRNTTPGLTGLARAICGYWSEQVTATTRRRSPASPACASFDHRRRTRPEAAAPSTTSLRVRRTRSCSPQLSPPAARCHRRPARRAAAPGARCSPAASRPPARRASRRATRRPRSDDDRAAQQQSQQSSSSSPACRPADVSSRRASGPRAAWARSAGRTRGLACRPASAPASRSGCARRWPAASWCPAPASRTRSGSPGATRPDPLAATPSGQHDEGSAHDGGRRTVVMGRGTPGGSMEGRHGLGCAPHHVVHSGSGYARQEPGGIVASGLLLFIKSGQVRSCCPTQRRQCRR